MNNAFDVTAATISIYRGLLDDDLVEHSAEIDALQLSVRAQQGNGAIWLDRQLQSFAASVISDANTTDGPPSAELKAAVSAWITHEVMTHDRLAFAAAAWVQALQAVRLANATHAEPGGAGPELPLAVRLAEAVDSVREESGRTT